jgi:acyl dehydratase
MSANPIRWKEGETLEPLRLPPVTRLDLIRYAGASGDFNPIHTIDADAEKAGLPGIIQHGMLTMAQLGRFFSPYLGHALLRHFAVRFMGMVFIGDVLVMEGRVTGVEETEEGTVFRCEVTARTDDGRTVVSGTAELLDFGS